MKCVIALSWLTASRLTGMSPFARKFCPNNLVYRMDRAVDQMSGILLRTMDEVNFFKLILVSLPIHFAYLEN